MLPRKVREIVGFLGLNKWFWCSGLEVSQERNHSKQGGKPDWQTFEKRPILGTQNSSHCGEKVTVEDHYENWQRSLHMR
jgi:hypothetical protein